MCFIEVVGAALFFVTSFYVVRDKQNVDIAIQGELELVVDGWIYVQKGGKLTKEWSILKIKLY